MKRVDGCALEHSRGIYSKPFWVEFGSLKSISQKFKVDRRSLETTAMKYKSLIKRANVMQHFTLAIDFMKFLKNSESVQSVHNPIKTARAKMSLMSRVSLACSEIENRRPQWRKGLGRALSCSPNRSIISRDELRVRELERN